jgi:peptidoglycan/xylan/chitin deacetylase (PgdA/CDA1 family)
MENKRKRRRYKRNPIDYVIFGVLAILFVAAIVWIAGGTKEYTIDIQLNGSAEVTLEYGTAYEDAGAVAQCYSDNQKKDPVALEVQTESNVDTSKVGTYRVIYTATYKQQTKTLERTVHVVDTQMPVISLVSDPEKFTLPGQIYEEEGFTAIDGHDGDLTHLVERTVTDTEVIYKVTDASGNTAEVRRTIRFHDPEAPVLTLLGDAEITLEAGTAYQEPGFTAMDNCEGDVSHLVDVTGNVNIWSAGTYVVTYTVSDSYGNTATATRKVNVTGKQTGDPVEGNGKVIYLTFDDGPSDHTLKLLDVLDKYNVKVTFFVAGTGRTAYLSQMAERGHAIGLHSVTHEYGKIYASEEAYFDDLYGIQSLVEQQIGYKTWLMRFPGGSSNKESMKYCKGIMTKLTKSVVEKGFHYFDWNVDSNDAGGAKSADEVFRNVTDGCSRNKDYFIVLQHDIRGFSVEAVEDIIIWGLSNGFTFEKLTEDSPGCHHPVNN